MISINVSDLALFFGLYLPFFATFWVIVKTLRLANYS